MAWRRFLLPLLSVLPNALFSPAAPVILHARQGGVTALSTNQVDAFTPLTHFASAAYCPASQTKTWQCGAHCQANPDFIPAASGGDGAVTQFWFVGFSPSLQSVIVAHQGTNPSRIIPIATDLAAVLQSPDPSLFPGISPTVEIHSGFANEHALTANDVLAAVQTTMSGNKVNRVTVVGHSLGAALALLDAVFLSLHLPGASVSIIGYGMPRVGNQDFANLVNARFPVTRINNQKDPVPTVPGDFLGYVHTSGEVHITESGAFESCPGPDNTSPLCTNGDVPNIFASRLADHDGPYNGVTMGC